MFKITKTNTRNEEREYTAYGVAAVENDIINILCADISSDAEFVQSIVDKCNTLDAAPEHIMDIIYDYIN